MIFHHTTREDEDTRRRIVIQRWKDAYAEQKEKNHPTWLFEREWHPWFAWFPVDIRGDHPATAWLSWVERKLMSSREPDILASWQIRSYVYRLPPEKI